jgi:ABC-type phosphate/phosphonate transport system substrate-binding protein
LHNGAHPAIGYPDGEDHMSSTKLSCLLAIASLVSGCAQSVVVAEGRAATPQQDIDFISIVADPDTTAADARLKRFLERAVGAGAATGADQRVRFDQRTMSYGDVIRAFAEPEGKRYIARITPYAYVAAELLGAKARILAVYQSVATRSTTYQAYFVVRRNSMTHKSKPGETSSTPDLEDVAQYLKTFASKPAKFIYHDRFSTSSYFMPSLYFRKHGVFAMGASLSTHFTPISVDRFQSTSSSDLVRQVAEGHADLAAVWDGTKTKFTETSGVIFIPIPTVVPNDFLVASGIDDATERLIVDAIRTDPGAGRACTSLNEPHFSSGDGRPARKPCEELDAKIRPQDDFDAWYAWDSYDDVTDAARHALARLRQDARQKPTPVVVKVRGRVRSDGREDPSLISYVEAAKEAVRLSGTEFVLWDPDLHRRVDMTWTLASTHDGALELTSDLEGFDVMDDPFKISFVNRDDLPRRIADLARSRLRRVRYVWPYEQKYPAVLRDLDFTPDQQVLVQKISWLDPARNEYEEDDSFKAQIERNTDFSKLRLSDAINFPKNPDGSFNFDPMSNVAYRVVIARRPEASPIWVALPYCFIGLLGLACVGLAIDLRRQRPSPIGLRQTYERLVEAYHLPWIGRPVEEGAILWCDHDYLDELVKELKRTGSPLDLVQGGAADFNFGPIPIRFSLLMKVGARLFTRRPLLAADLVDCRQGGPVGALDALVQFLIYQGRLAPFVGLPEGAGDAARPPAWPIEWEALNDIASRHFERLGIGDARVDASLDGSTGALASVVSGHFLGVVRKAARDASLFHQTWTVREPGTPGRLVFEGRTRTALLVSGQSGSARTSTIRLEVTLPPAAVLPSDPGGSTLRAWVLGKVLTTIADGDVLALHVKPIAVLRDSDDQQ